MSKGKKSTVYPIRLGDDFVAMYIKPKADKQGKTVGIWIRDLVKKESSRTHCKNGNLDL